MTDYAIVLLAELSRSAPFTTTRLQEDNSNQENTADDSAPNHFMSAGDLAALTIIPLPTVQLLLKKLTAGEMLWAERGRDGGYKLAKPLSSISVFDVLLLMEGAPALTACVHDNDDRCERTDYCQLTGRWQKINKVIQVALQEITLSDLLSDDKTFHKNFQHFLSTSPTA